MSELFSAIRLSLAIAGCATLLAVMLAIPLAYWLARWRFPGKSVVEGLIIMPLVLPPTVVGYLLLVAFGAKGIFSKILEGYSITFRFEGAVLAACIVAFPMLYLPARAAFNSIDPDLESTARLFGATRLQLFFQVSLPLAQKGIASGLLLAFARALGEFGATVMVFGWQPNRLTLPVSIYSDYEQGNLAHAWPAVLALSVFSLGLTMLYNASSAGRWDRE